LAGTKIAPSYADVEAVKAALDAELLRLAIDKGAVKSAAEAVCRDLMPDTDLLASGDIQYFQQTLAAGWNSPTYSGENPDDKVFGIYGVMSTTHSGDQLRTCYTTAIRFWDEVSRSALKDLWNVQALRTQQSVAEPLIVLAESPIIYEPTRGFNIDQYAIGASVDQIVYLGRVCEPKGKTVKGEKIA
jgi:hypothetical protein